MRDRDSGLRPHDYAITEGNSYSQATQVRNRSIGHLYVANLLGRTSKAEVDCQGRSAHEAALGSWAPLPYEANFSQRREE